MPDPIELRPEKTIRLPPHYRVWVPCRAPPGCKSSMAVLTDDEGLKNQFNRKRGLSIRPTMNYIRKGKVHVLAENLSDIPLRLNTSYVLAHGFPMVEPGVDWARGKYSHLQVLSILQQEMEQEQGSSSKEGWHPREWIAGGTLVKVFPGRREKNGVKKPSSSTRTSISRRTRTS